MGSDFKENWCRCIISEENQWFPIDKFVMVHVSIDENSIVINKTRLTWSFFYPSSYTFTRKDIVSCIRGGWFGNKFKIVVMNNNKEHYIEIWTGKVKEFEEAINNLGIDINNKRYNIE